MTKGSTNILGIEFCICKKVYGGKTRVSKGKNENGPARKYWAKKL
jgi:hypothetical protein